MKALTIVEIDIPVCSLTYGTAPCTATLVGENPTGTIKCFNSIKTCQDRENFDETTQTLRFAQGAAYLPKSFEAIPSIINVEFSPGTVSLGTDLGQRSTLKVTFRDHPHSDTGAGFDKYLSDRTYVPFDQGTFFGKFRARHPYLRGRAVRWYQGELGDALADMEVRHYVIESFDGPSADGVYVLTAKDPLKLLDGDRAQAPLPSNGFLLADIDADDTAATLSPSGIGDAEYPASGFVCIGGKEVCAFTRSGDSLTLTRAQRGTSARTHSNQDRVQLVLTYDAVDAAEIIQDLEETYGGIPSSYINIDDWTTETASFLGRVYTATIVEPTPVKKLVEELIQQAGLAHWWDDTQQKLRLQVLRAVSSDAALYDENNRLANPPVTITEQPDKRISRVTTYFGQVDPTRRVDEADNYRSVETTIDAQAEADYGVSAIKKIYSRWIPQFGRPAATRLNQILLSRYRDAPRKIGFSILRGGAVPVLGGGYKVAGHFLQDATGARVEIPVQVTRLKPGPAVIGVEAEEMLFHAPSEDPNDRVVIIDFNSFDFNLRTTHDTLYPPAVAGNTVTCIVNAGVIAGATATGVPALDVGDWPTLELTGSTANASPVITDLSEDTKDLVAGMRVMGAGIPAGAKILSVDSSSQITLDADATATATGVSITIYLIRIVLKVRGRIQGKGGQGAGAGNQGGFGGPALYTRYAIDLEVADGEIWGGGGGGGGAVYLPGTTYSIGGGGGSGSEPGEPGINNYGAAPRAGTSEAGGAGGGGYPAIGGVGGGPGLVGGAASYDVHSSEVAPTSPGAPGRAIDGISYVNITTGPGDIRYDTGN